MLTVVLAERPFEPESWTRHEVDDLRAFLMARFPEWPATARIYHEQMVNDEKHDVTPKDALGVARLGSLTGTVYVVVYPAGARDVIYGAMVAGSAVAAILGAWNIAVPLWIGLGMGVLSELLQCTPRNDLHLSARAPTLSARSNQPRVGGRIPDPFGTARVYPDMIGVPLITYEGSQQVETAYLCVGRGAYEILSVEEGSPNKAILDSSTPVKDITGESVYIYGPYKSPNNATPDVSICVPGEETPTGKVLTVKRIEAVSGQGLHRADAIITFTVENEVMVMPKVNGYYVLELGKDSSQAFTDYFYKGQRVQLNVTLTSGSSVSGYYDIADLTATQLFLTPGGTNTTAWDALSVQSGTRANAWVMAMYEKWMGGAEPNNWAGPFFVDAPDATGLSFNFVAPNGLWFYDTAVESGQVQLPIRAQIKVQMIPCDASGIALPGAVWIEKSVWLTGASGPRSLIGATLQFPWRGRCLVRARNALSKDKVTALLDPDGHGHPFDNEVEVPQWVDAVNWADLFATTEVAQPHFGNVTTVLAKTRANATSAAVKERKLNLLVRRRVPHRVSGTTFTPTIDDWVKAATPLDPAQPTPSDVLTASAAIEAATATSRADDILVAAATDPCIGGRGIDELDVTNIYDTIAAVESNFAIGAPCVEFNGSFVQDNLSAQETLSTIAEAVFCHAYRRANLIRLTFDHASEDAALLFNHRNKIPGTETRQTRFGVEDRCDGVEYTYTSPIDDAETVFHIPEDLSATNPKKVTGVGVRSRISAYYHAYRIWNMLRYQNTSVEFDATEEANILGMWDRILVADNTRPDTQDGDVLAQDGLTLTLSRSVGV